MDLHNDFDVAAPVDEVWAYMLDVEKIAPCMPGAELTEVVDDKNWKGKVTVKVGPVSMAFLGTVTMQERDEAAKRVVLKADGRDSRGKGAANALVTAKMEPAGDGTKVSIDTDLTITGAAAQYARGGMIQDISGRLTKEFANCLQTNMQAAGAAAAASAPAAGAGSGAPAGAGAPAPPATPKPAQAARPVGGVRLAVWAFWRSVVRFFTKIFGSSKGSQGGT
jgi:carbon monoxide dehydrogenase subunit G